MTTFSKVSMQRIFHIWRKKDANVAMIFGLCLPLLIAMTFGAIEFNRIVHVEQQLKAATDASVLAGVNEAYVAHQDGVARDQLSRIAEAEAQKMFQVLTAQLNTNDTPSLNLTTTLNGNNISMRGNYSGRYQTEMSWPGSGDRETLNIAGRSSATASTPGYAQVALLFDVSASMGIGATATDQQTMSTHTNCAFACHYSRNWRGRSPDRSNPDHDPEMSDYEFIQKMGAQTRLDVSKTGALAGIDALDAANLSSDQVGVNVFTFDNYVQHIVGFGDANQFNYSNVKSKIENEVSFKRWHGGSNADFAIRELLRTMPEGSHGGTADTRSQYLIILTDGISNRARRIRRANEYDDSIKWPWSRWSGQPRSEIYPTSPSRSWGSNNWLHTAVSTETCELLREHDVQPLFILTPYMFPSSGAHANDSRFNYIRNSLQPLIYDRYVECAGSRDFVIEANTPQNIEDAFTNLFAKIYSPLRLF